MVSVCSPVSEKGLHIIFKLINPKKKPKYFHNLSEKYSIAITL